MSLASYEVFIAIVERGSLAAAAEFLHMSPSAVSHALANFEAQLGFALMTRGRAGTNLTPQGQALIPLAKEALRAHKKLIEHATELKGLSTGTVKIAAFSSVSVAWMPELVRTFRASYPMVTVHVNQGSYDDVLSALSLGEADLGFVTTPAAPQFDVAPLYADQMVCVAPGTFAPLNPWHVSLEELTDQELIGQHESNSKEIRDILKKASASMQSTIKAVDDIVILAMVEKGLGVAIMPELALQNQKAQVRSYPLEPPVIRNIGLASRSEALLSPAAKAMHAHILSFVANWRSSLAN